MDCKGSKITIIVFKGFYNILALKSDHDEIKLVNIRIALIEK